MGEFIVSMVLTVKDKFSFRIKCFNDFYKYHEYVSKIKTLMKFKDYFRILCILCRCSFLIFICRFV